MAKLKNWLVIAVVILLIAMLICNGALIWQAVTVREKTPSLFGWKAYVILSGSMEPQLQVGDLVIVKETENVQVGDIISYRQGNSVVTHRVCQINETGYITKGDANNAYDPQSVPFCAIEGKMQCWVPLVGKAVLLLQNKYVMLIICLGFGLCLIPGKKEKTHDSQAQ